jgi:hypothetical protein
MSDLQACFAVVSGCELCFFEHELAVIRILGRQQHGVPCATDASSPIHYFFLDQIRERE